MSLFSCFGTGKSKYSRDRPASSIQMVLEEYSYPNLPELDTLSKNTDVSRTMNKAAESFPQRNLTHLSPQVSQSHSGVTTLHESKKAVDPSASSAENFISNDAIEVYEAFTINEEVTKPESVYEDKKAEKSNLFVRAASINKYLEKATQRNKNSISVSTVNTGDAPYVISSTFSKHYANLTGSKTRELPYPYKTTNNASYSGDIDNSHHNPNTTVTSLGNYPLHRKMSTESGFGWARSNSISPQTPKKMTNFDLPTVFEAAPQLKDQETETRKDIPLKNIENSAEANTSTLLKDLRPGKDDSYISSDENSDFYDHDFDHDHQHVHQSDSTNDKYNQVCSDDDRDSDISMKKRLQTKDTVQKESSPPPATQDVTPTQLVDSYMTVDLYSSIQSIDIDDPVITEFSENQTETLASSPTNKIQLAAADEEKYAVEEKPASISEAVPQQTLKTYAPTAQKPPSPAGHYVFPLEQPQPTFSTKKSESSLKSVKGLSLPSNRKNVQSILKKFESNATVPEKPLPKGSLSLNREIKAPTNLKNPEAVRKLVLPPRKSEKFNI